MTPIKSPLERFSAGEISRIELGEMLGHPISFGDMLMQLHQHGLPLPRYGRPYNQQGIDLLVEHLNRRKSA